MNNSGMSFPPGIVETVAVVLLVSSCSSVPRDLTTVLHLAAENGDASAVFQLLEEGSLVNARDKEGRTALHLAAAIGNLAVTAALLNAGADPDLLDKAGRVPLHYAALDCNADLAAMLLGAGAHPFVIDKERRKPKDLAKDTGCEEVVDTIASAVTARDQ